jgi:acetyl esterase/lipase
MAARDVLTRPADPPDGVLRYGEHPDQVVDVRLGSGGAGAPVVVLLHGGFWRAEHDRVHTRPMADALAGLGFTVCTPEYRRTGQDGGGYPGTFDDVAAGVDRVLAGPPTAGGVVLVGHSAGGHLALWSALRHRLPEGSRWRADLRIDGVVALAPVSDLGAALDAGVDDGAAEALLGGRRERLAVTDPVRLLPYGAGPLVLVHGTADDRVPVEMSRAFAARERAARLVELPGAGHFDLIDPLSAAWPATLAAIMSVTRAS